ncbi:Rpn family recombination-promoting nuclease/putative transposase [Escherichia coli]|nr:Rpn family recombination-promoting nuclease/putative transposase [Escherichia coli]
MNWPTCFDNPEIADKTCTELFHLVDMTVMDGDEIMQYRKQSFSPLCYPLWQQSVGNGRVNHLRFR